jgi:mRNA interferase RelE/StbE
MKYNLRLTHKAKKDLVSLNNAEQKRIIQKLKFFIGSKNPLHYAKKLNNLRLGTYRFRIGDYRAIFDIDKNGNIFLLTILRIKHRKEVYE